MSIVSRTPVNTRGRRTILSVLATLVTCLAAWFAFAPPALGGATSYVMTEGASMLPHYHAGELVALRAQASYHVGDIVAYHNGSLGVVVMHRIVATDGDRYVFKGDNNNFIDSYHATKSEIVGAEWLQLPGAGRLLARLRVPIVAAVAFGLLWFFSFPAQRTSRRQRRRRRHAH